MLGRFDTLYHRGNENPSPHDTMNGDKYVNAYCTLAIPLVNFTRATKGGLKFFK
jgi:hypothetical protein